LRLVPLAIFIAELPTTYPVLLVRTEAIPRTPFSKVPPTVANDVKAVPVFKPKLASDVPRDVNDAAREMISKTLPASPPILLIRSRSSFSSSSTYFLITRS
jgi:hypothetical protein